MVLIQTTVQKVVVIHLKLFANCQKQMDIVSSPSNYATVFLSVSGVVMYLLQHLLIPGELQTQVEGIVH